LVKAPEKLDKEARAKQFSCENEIALAKAVFGKFWTEQVAQQLAGGIEASPLREREGKCPFAARRPGGSTNFRR